MRLTFVHMYASSSYILQYLSDTSYWRKQPYCGTYHRFLVHKCRIVWTIIHFHIFDLQCSNRAPQAIRWCSLVKGPTTEIHNGWLVETLVAYHHITTTKTVTGWQHCYQGQMPQNKLFGTNTISFRMYMKRFTGSTKRKGINFLNL